MLENYRRKEVVKAEQYDGSQDVVDRYGIHSRAVNGKVMDISSTDMDNYVLEKGDWIVIKDDGYVWHYSDTQFNRIYEKVRDND